MPQEQVVGMPAAGPSKLELSGPRGLLQRSYEYEPRALAPVDHSPSRRQNVGSG